MFDGTTNRGGGIGFGRGRSARSIAVIPLMVLAVLTLVGASLLAPTAVSAQDDPKPVADLRIQASVEEGPPGGGISTIDGVRYDFRFVNGGPDPIPAGALLVVIFVGNGGAEPVTMEVSRFGGGGLVPAGAGSGCGIGRREIVRCTNLSELPPDREIRLRFENRHPEAVAGDLALSVDVLARTGNDGDLFTDPATGNNAYRGPTYRFANQPTTTTSSTTTTTEPTTTTTESSTSSSDSSSTTDPSSTTTTTSSSSTTTTAPTTTSSSTTTTTQPTTTTTQPTTTTTMATTTTVATTASSTTTSLQPTVALDNSVLGQSTVETSVLDQALVPTGPGSDDDGGGGFPFLLLAGLLALSALLIGVAIAVYYFYFWEESPPLVDLREFDQQPRRF